jgi:hypothetical protein
MLPSKKPGRPSLPKLTALGFTPSDGCAVYSWAEKENCLRPDCCLQVYRNTTEKTLGVSAVLIKAILSARTGNAFQPS